MLGYAHRVMPRRCALLLAVHLAACGPGESGLGVSGGDLDPTTITSTSTSTGGDPTTGTHATTVADTGATSSGVTTDDVGASDDPPSLRWDLGPEIPPDPFAGPPVWCAAKKVDFLFVVSRNDFMESVQTSLIQSLPGILGRIEDLFADFDFHIMVVDADGDAWGDPECATAGACAGDFGCAAIDEPLYPCWAPKAGEITFCDIALGGGVVFPAAKGASNKRCPVPAGRRYLRRGDPGLAEAFECVGRVGYGAGGSAPGKMLMGLDAPELDGPYGCNLGFLRDDALLFVTLIQIGGEGPPYGPLVWAQGLQAVKSFEPNAIFMLGFLSDGEPLLCPWADGGGPLEEYVGHFDNSLLLSVCAPSFVPGFTQAAKAALALCDALVPE